MSFLVIYLAKTDHIVGRRQESRAIVESLNDISSLSAESILEIYEIVRRVPFVTKYREEERVIVRRPFYEIDGAVEIDRGRDESPQERALMDFLKEDLPIKND